MKSFYDEDKQSLILKLENYFFKLDTLSAMEQFFSKLLSHLEKNTSAISERKIIGDSTARIILHFFAKRPFSLPSIFPLLHQALVRGFISPLSLELLKSSIRENPSLSSDQNNDFRQMFTQFLISLPKTTAKPKKSAWNPYVIFSEPATDSRPCDRYNLLNSVQSIFETDYKKAASTINALSFALLDLEGNFIFACKTARRQFGLTSHNMYKKKFQDLLIPFSISQLNQEFTDGLFNFTQKPDIKKKITYVIFSRHAEKCFKTNARLIPDAKKVQIYTSMTDSDVANLCLENMTSTIELVQLKITKEDYENFQTEDGDVRSLFRGPNSIKSKNIFKRFRPDRLKRTKKIAENFKKDKSEGARSDTQPMILMKTRLSTHMPDFPYSLLKDHYKIKSFRKLLLQQLKKQK